MKNVKKVYMSETEGLNRRGRLLGRSKDRVKEYIVKEALAYGGA